RGDRLDAGVDRAGRAVRSSTQQFWTKDGRRYRAFKWHAVVAVHYGLRDRAVAVGRQSLRIPPALPFFSRTRGITTQGVEPWHYGRTGDAGGVYPGGRCVDPAI